MYLTFRTTPHHKCTKCTFIERERRQKERIVFVYRLTMGQFLGKNKSRTDFSLLINLAIVALSMLKITSGLKNRIIE